MPSSHYLRSHRLPRMISVLYLISAVIAGCARSPSRPDSRKVREILARGAPWADNTFYACLVTYYAQGLSFKQIQAECETKLGYADQKGWGPASRSDLLGSFSRDRKPFDASKVTTACHTGDSRVAGEDVQRGRVIHEDPYHNLGSEDYGKYSWGGKGKCGADFCYRGLSEEQSAQEKLDAIRAAEKAFDLWKKVDAEAQGDPSDKAKAKAAGDAKRDAEEKMRKAYDDPNKKPKPKKGAEPIVGDPVAPDPGTAVARGPGGEASPCEQALQEAREILGECQRTGWKSYACQSLLAQKNGCPDPALIYVDPDAGYQCGATIDPEVLKQAWVDKCHELKRPVPGGPDPCAPPEVDPSGRHIKGDGGTLCGNELARIDPDSPECLQTLRVQNFAPDLHELLVWGLDKLGGPIVVLDPKTGTDPAPGDDRPKPDPRPR